MMRSSFRIKSFSFVKTIGLILIPHNSMLPKTVRHYEKPDKKSFHVILQILQYGLMLNISYSRYESQPQYHLYHPQMPIDGHGQYKG